MAPHAPPLILRANFEYRSRMSNNEGRYACGVSIYIIAGAKRLHPSTFEIRLRYSTFSFQSLSQGNRM